MKHNEKCFKPTGKTYIFGRKQPMRREMAKSLLKAKIKIKQIGGFTKSLFKYVRVWTWIAYFLKLIPNLNLKISISNILFLIK